MVLYGYFPQFSVASTMDLAIGFIIFTLYIILETAIATYAYFNARSFHPVRYLIATCITLSIVSLVTTLRIFTTSPIAVMIFSSVSAIALGLTNITVLLLFAALFVPQWWHGSRPIRWIVLPNILFVAALTIDLIGQFHWFIQDFVSQNGIYRAVRTPISGAIMLIGFSLSWFFHLGVLMVAFAKSRRTRRLIAILIGSILLAGSVPWVWTNIVSGEIAYFAPIVQTAPFILALAYVTLRGHLFDTTRVALEFAIDNMNEGIVALKRPLLVSYTNPAAEKLGIHKGETIDTAIANLGIALEDQTKLIDYLGEARTQLTMMTFAFGVPINLYEVTISTVYNQEDDIQGHVMLFRDITEVERRTALLNLERNRLNDSVLQLRAEQEQRTQLVQTVQQLTFPVIPVLKGVLVVPLVGVFDAARINELQQVLTTRIGQERARRILIDLTGVQLIDQAGVAGLLDTINAARLLGAECTIVGVRPEIAQALVAFEAQMNRLATATTLQAGIEQVLSQQ